MNKEISQITRLHREKRNIQHLTRRIAFWLTCDTRRERRTHAAKVRHFRLLYIALWRRRRLFSSSTRVTLVTFHAADSLVPFFSTGASRKTRGKSKIVVDLVFDLLPLFWILRAVTFKASSESYQGWPPEKDIVTKSGWHYRLTWDERSYFCSPAQQRQWKDPTGTWKSPI